MTIFERLASYFKKNGGLNTVTGTLIPALIQILTFIDPTVAGAVQAAFDPETSTMLLHGGVGAIAALVIVIARVVVAIQHKPAAK